jgi:hypothetical protein
MTTLNAAGRPNVDADGPATRATLRIDRIAGGVLLAAVGAGWLLAPLGFAVPWRLAVPVALVLVGTTLSFTVVANRDGGVRAGRSGLAWLGAALLVLSVALGINAPQYAASAGNVRMAPTATQWPIEIRRSVGNVEIDLTRHPLPERGTIAVQLGAGNVELIVPRGNRMNIDVRVTTGQVLVDGRPVDDGVDLRWSQTSPTGPATTVQLGAGEVDIRHE